ncbi:MAG: AmmeMemoRadiSam system protein B [Syntrophobacteraceae bacterium]|jgi:AmmeMemoRadiSam system protein B
MTESEYPKLRNGLEAHPVKHGGQQMFVLRDRIGYAPESLVFSPAVVSILANMSGGKSLRDLQADFMRQTGQLLYIEELQNLVKTLDEHLFLDNDRFRSFAAKEASAFLDSPVRKMRHAGRSYPEDPEDLRKRLDSFFMPENGGPGFPDPAGARAEKMVALVAPHIDLNAGGACFAHAYKSAAEAQTPETWIVLGTGHDFIENCFALTVKDFQTPLGQLRCDTAICDELLRRVQFDIRASEYNHRTEHTIEFQAVFLSHMQPLARIVPILCSFGHEEWNSCNHLVDDFARNLAELVFGGNHSVGIIASVDMAHVGPRYGDRYKPNKATIQEHLSSDESLLKLLEKCNANDFIQKINRDANSRKICGVAPLYTMAKALEGRARGTTLRQSHAIVDEDGSFVTFASMAFYHDEGAR